MGNAGEKGKIIERDFKHDAVRNILATSPERIC